MLSDGIALQSKAVVAPGDESIIAEGASKPGNTGGSGKHSGQTSSGSQISGKFLG